MAVRRLHACLNHSSQRSSASARFFRSTRARFGLSQTPGHYSLHGPVGPATLRAGAGKMRTDTIPVAWVQIGKAYVAYHLMGVYGNPKLLQGCTPDLRGRMQGNRASTSSRWMMPCSASWSS